MNDRPIRVAYFDLGFSKEQYGLQPTKYGGGGVLARYMKEDSEIEFEIFAPREAFENIGHGERADRCHGLTREACEAFRRGYPVSEVFSFSSMPDILLHPHTCETLNRGTLDCPVVQFCGFDGKAGHPGNNYILLYDDSFTPQFGEKPKYVRIGKPVPEKFISYPKAGYVFQCSRHDDHMNSLELARKCKQFNIKGYFAGPIHNNYPLMAEIDGEVTHYLGEIDEATKLGFERHATLQCLLLKWDSPFNQTIIEAQGLGTPIYVNKRGPFLEKYLKHGVNGFDAGLFGLDMAFDAAFYLNQKDCWMAAREYDVSVMLSTFKKAFREIVTEWAAR